MSSLASVPAPLYADEVAAEVVAAAVGSGRIGPEERDEWAAEIRAGGRQGADAVMVLMETPDAETTYRMLYPDSPPPRLPAEPDWMAMTDMRLAWKRQHAAAGPATETIDHSAVTVEGHTHMHSSYAGGVHRHPHSHVADRSHAPGVNHWHRMASADPVARGIAARAATTGAPDLSADEIYRRLGYI